ncbi:hypothetical protein BSUW23_04535 [Bacillus spizizenii str. W23]|uniref:Uncharacterized protein n=1 Tax=Bacillus spizizenii (strain ATCC 23059 / NRRL B-14472 / W23) TaxID=655816 RepID=E0TWX7_BACSH|nr:hypothetical protein BSUW23_04535 [Bacillus spizizenii str. W23]EFG91127.1 hypothetical protein BSU6633_14477 [Bacillus spizizenii ATCC 6633 = JCM 2499]
MKSPFQGFFLFNKSKKTFAKKIRGKKEIFPLTNLLSFINILSCELLLRIGVKRS